MAESAFGVEHGDDVSKAMFRMPGQFLGQAANAGKGAANSFKAGMGKPVTGPKPGRFSGSAFQAGSGAQRAGGAVKQNKGALGMGAAGGAGIGAAGYGAGRKNSRTSTGQIR